jgi:general secretion pathway protein C
VAGSLLERGRRVAGASRFSAVFMLLSALLLAFVIVQAARLFWALATPVAPVGDWKAPTPPVMDSGARDQLFNAFDPFFRTVVAPQLQDSEVITALPLTLYGIRSNEASGVGSAIIAGGDGVQQSLAVGEEVVPGVLLHAVAFDHVVVSNNGVLEKLFMDQSVPAKNVTPAGPPPTSGAPPNMSKGPAVPPTGEVKLNPQNFAQAIDLAPRKDGGKITGLVVSAKDDGSMLKAAGLQTGDIILSVNGTPARSASDIASQVRPGARLSVEIERGSQKIPVAIILEQK